MIRQVSVPAIRCSGLLPGLGHPAARPAARGLAEPRRELPLGQGRAGLSASLVAGHSGGFDARLTPAARLARSGPACRSLARLVR
jgi:hypothetical protein